MTRASDKGWDGLGSNPDPGRRRLPRGWGPWVVELREAAGVSQRALAAAAGVSVGYMSQVESELSPPPATVGGRFDYAAAAELLGVTEAVLKRRALACRMCLAEGVPWRHRHRPTRVIRSRRDKRYDRSRHR